MLTHVLTSSGPTPAAHGPLTGNPWIDWAILITILSAGAAVLAKLLRSMRTVTRFVDDFREDWFGTPGRPGVDGRPGVMVRLKAIEAEIRPNGGGSIKDAVTAIRQTVQETKTDTEALRVDVAAAKTAAAAAQDTAQATQTALAGHLQQINGGSAP